VPKAKPEPAEEAGQEKKNSKKETKVNWVASVGRRKRSVARVRMWLEKNGKIVVNENPIEKYFPAATAAKKYEEPLRVTNHLGQFGVSIKVRGGGSSGQLGAVVQGLANTLVAFDASFREPLAKNSLLTRDSREKERRKYGLAGKARARKQSPKR